MDLYLWTLLLATIGLLWYILKALERKRRMKGLKEVPGPKGLPLVGNLFQMSQPFYKQNTLWSKQYGKIYQRSMGSLTTVVISDPKWAKEMLSDPICTGGLHLPSFDPYEDTPDLGIFSLEGEKWEVHRRFLLRQMREFGFGKSSMETRIRAEVDEMIENFNKMVGKPIKDIRLTFTIAVVNSLWSILSSQRFNHDDPELVKLTNNTSTTFTEVSQKGFALFVFPWLKHIIPEKCGYNAIRQVIEETKEFLERGVAQHKKDFNEDVQNDYIDGYLNEMKKAEKDPKSTFHGEIGERHLVAILADLFRAGGDTTATTLTWSVLYLCKFLNVQRKFQAEIDEVTGNMREVCLDDRRNMPYTTALIDEILRYSSIVPDGVTHGLLADKEFHGYFIPKGTNIQPNLRLIHFNPELFGEDVEQFNPERFLTEGKRNKLNENLLPFQVGRRECPGQSLARDSIFLFMTNLFQKFNMVFDPNEEEPGVEPEPGFIMAPYPFQVIMTKRR